MSVQTFNGQIRIDTASGVVEQDVKIIIDLDAIAKALGPRAFKSKGKRSQFLKGAVVVKQIAARAATF